MTRLLALTAIAAALMTSACITINDAPDWHGQGAEPFDAAREHCSAQAGGDQSSRAFDDCMKAKGWSQD